MPRPIRHLTVLYDATCELCRAARAWLEDEPAYVPLVFISAGSTLARQRFPALDPQHTLRDITVVDDEGRVYRGAKAWIICLWATRRWREWSLRLSTPQAMPSTRRFVHWVSHNRGRLRGVGRLLRRFA